MRWVRLAGTGISFTFGVVVLALSVVDLRSHDFVSAIVLCVMGLALMGSATELSRPLTGE